MVSIAYRPWRLYPKRHWVLIALLVLVLPARQLAAGDSGPHVGLDAGVALGPSPMPELNPANSGASVTNGLLPAKSAGSANLNLGIGGI
jgi:hypothetical protein